MVISFLSTQRGLLSFDELVADVVDEVLRSIFGERLTFSIWTYLEVNFVGRADVARKPEAFEESLEKLFGFAVKALERRIIKRLCQMLKVELELRESIEFSDCIRKLRNLYLEILAAKYKPLITR